MWNVIKDNLLISFLCWLETRNKLFFSFVFLNEQMGLAYGVNYLAKTKKINEGICGLKISRPHSIKKKKKQLKNIIIFRQKYTFGPFILNWFRFWYLCFKHTYLSPWKLKIISILVSAVILVTEISYIVNGVLCWHFLCRCGH